MKPQNLCPNVPPAKTPLHKVCEVCPMVSLDGWRMRAARMRDELRRHKISDTERRLAEAILDITFGWGRAEVMVPELKFFSAMTGMEKPHVHEAIASLHLQRIIRVVKLKGQLHYSLREDSDNWKASPRELMQDRDERLNHLREVNELPAGKGFPGFFDPLAAAEKTGAGVTESVTKPVIAQTETLPDLE